MSMAEWRQAKANCPDCGICRFCHGCEDDDCTVGGHCRCFEDWEDEENE